MMQWNLPLSFLFFLQLLWPTSLPRLMDYRKKQRRLPAPSTYRLTRYTIWGAFGWDTGGHSTVHSAATANKCALATLSASEHDPSF